MLKPVIAAACLCLGTITGGAQSGGLSGQQISDLVAGATIEIDTPAGTKIPVRYAADGQLAGEGRELAWYLGAATDTGRWWVSGDQLCHKWVRWFSAEPQCMRIAREGRQFRWKARDGNTGTAMITVPAPPPVAVAAVTALPRLPLKRPAPAVVQKDVAVAPLPAPAEPPSAEPAGEMTAEEIIASLRPKQSNALIAIAPQPFAAMVEIAPATPPPAKQPEPATTAPPPPAKQAEPKRPAAPAQPPMFKVANVSRDDVLNIRSGPSADHDIVGELPPDGRGIAITSDCRSRWCPVVHRSLSGWVNSTYLVPEEPLSVALHGPAATAPAFRDSPEAPRACLTAAARALLDRIEQKFGRVRVVSTCRAGATIAGSGRPSRHASGNAVDFDAGPRKAEILEWLIATHRSGGVMTYHGMDHIHVDIGPHFVSIAGGRHWSSWNRTRRE